MPRATRSSTKYNFRQIPKKNLNWNAMAPPLPSDDSENESGRDNLSASFSTSTSSNASFNESRTPQAKLCFNSKLLKPSVLRNNPIVTRRARHMPLINNTIELGSDEEKPQKRKTRGHLPEVKLTEIKKERPSGESRDSGLSASPASLVPSGSARGSKENANNNKAAPSKTKEQEKSHNPHESQSSSEHSSARWNGHNSWNLEEFPYADYSENDSVHNRRNVVDECSAENASIFSASTEADENLVLKRANKAKNQVQVKLPSIGNVMKKVAPSSQMSSKLMPRRKYEVPNHRVETNTVEYPDSLKVTYDRVGKLVAPFLTPGPKIVSDTIVLDDSSMLCEDEDDAQQRVRNWAAAASTLRRVPESISSIASESSSMLCEEYGSLLVRTLEKDRPTSSKTAGTTVMDSAQVKDIMKDFGDKLLGQFMDLCSKRLEQPEPNSCKTCVIREVSRESQACQTDIRSNVPIKLEFQKLEPISFQSAQYSQDVLKPPMPKIVNHSVSSLTGRFQRLELCSMVGKTAQMKDVESEVPQNAHNLYKSIDAKIDNEKFYSPHINEYDSYDLSTEDSTNSLLEVTKSLLEQSTSIIIPALEKTPCRYCGTPFKEAKQRRIHYVKEHLKDIFGEGSQQCQSPMFQDDNCSSQNQSIGFEYDEGTYDNFGSHNSERTEEISTQSAEYSLESGGIEIPGTPESRVTPKPKSRQEVCLEFTNEENSSADNARNSGPLYYCENGHDNCDDCKLHYDQLFTRICNAIDTTPTSHFRNQTRTSNGSNITSLSSEPVRETSFMAGLSRQKSCSIKESTRIGSCLGSEQSFLDQSVNLEEPRQEYMSQELEDDKENGEQSTSLYGMDQFRENLRALATPFRNKSILSLSTENRTEGTRRSNIPTSPTTYQGLEDDKENREITPCKPKKILSLSKENCTVESSQSDIPTSVNCEEESQQSKYDASRDQTPQPSFARPIPKMSTFMSTPAVANRAGIKDVSNQNLYSFCAPLTYSSEEFSDENQY
ncbi:hypothetical protein DdX_08129 [Ditylenchus destructor]|uniref:C2H2-type domain-containing protein n=1 Tax=Ditylenchus destructor TaxID=166010 RepID=A0AAD4N4P3_9BILA|nr:hypothetical protein DdX_08129 [Ditylenchus destructor]